MISKNFFIFMFLIVGGASLYLGGEFFYNLNRYFHLTHSEEAQVSDWKVVEIKSGKFSVEAVYQFQIEERAIMGTYAFSKPVYPNPYLAEDLVEAWQEKTWEIWYNPKQPHDAALQKVFPAKKAIHFALSLGIILYFAFLNIYVKRMHFSEEENEKAPS